MNVLCTPPEERRLTGRQANTDQVGNGKLSDDDEESNDEDDHGGRFERNLGTRRSARLRARMYRSVRGGIGDMMAQVAHSQTAGGGSSGPESSHPWALKQRRRRSASQPTIDTHGLFKVGETSTITEETEAERENRRSRTFEASQDTSKPQRDVSSERERKEVVDSQGATRETSVKHDEAPHGSVGEASNEEEPQATPLHDHKEAKRPGIVDGHDEKKATMQGNCHQVSAEKEKAGDEKEKREEVIVAKLGQLQEENASGTDDDKNETYEDDVDEEGRSPVHQNESAVEITGEFEPPLVVGNGYEVMLEEQHGNQKLDHDASYEEERLVIFEAAENDDQSNEDSSLHFQDELAENGESSVREEPDSESPYASAIKPTTGKEEEEEDQCVEAPPRLEHRSSRSIDTEAPEQEVEPRPTQSDLDQPVNSRQAAINDIMTRNEDIKDDAEAAAEEEVRGFQKCF